MGFLSVLYLMFNEGYLSREAEAAMRRDLANDADWLTRLVASLMPDQAEVLGLLALMKLTLARSRARFDASGELVLLPDQDRSLWDSAAIAEGVELLESRTWRGQRPRHLTCRLPPVPLDAR